jgi:hypothetical protein
MQSLFVTSCVAHGEIMLVTTHNRTSAWTRLELHERDYDQPTHNKAFARNEVVESLMTAQEKRGLKGKLHAAAGIGSKDRLH